MKHLALLAFTLVAGAVQPLSRTAVKTTFPPYGKTPEIKNDGGLWAPTFIK